MSILVTGASGFVGLNVVEHLLAEGRAVVALSHDRLPEPARAAFAALPGRLVEITDDVAGTDTIARVVAAQGIASAIHLAAMTPAADLPAAAAPRVLDVNVMGTLAMLEVAVAAKLRRVVVASSGAVYGEAVFSDTAPDEDTLPAPPSLYALTKLLGEKLMRRFREGHGLDAVAIRPGAVFGPWERDTGLRATLSPPYELAQLASRGEAARIVSAGERDWVYSRDVARAVAAIHDTPRLAHDVYNIAAPAVWNLRIVAEAFARALPGFTWRAVGSVDEANIRYFTPVDRLRQAPRVDRLQRDLGFAFRYPPELAAADYAVWIKAHPLALVRDRTG